MFDFEPSPRLLFSDPYCVEKHASPPRDNARLPHANRKKNPRKPRIQTIYGPFGRVYFSYSSTTPVAARSTCKLVGTKNQRVTSVIHHRQSTLFVSSLL